MALPQKLQLHKRPGAGLFTVRPLMTLRISRDSGKTWGPERVVFSGNGLIPSITSEWPPCRCSRCKACPEVTKAFGALTDHCFVCHVCKATPDQMCPKALQLHRAWKTVWKETLHSDVRNVRPANSRRRGL